MPSNGPVLLSKQTFAGVRVSHNAQGSETTRTGPTEISLKGQERTDNRHWHQEIDKYLLQE